MSELISGKAAKLAWANDKEVEYMPLNKWNLLGGSTPLSIFDRDDVKFRLKPRTITLNGIEVPACGTDYKPHTFMFVLNSLEPCEYSKIILDDSDEMPLYWWKSEEEIKQVIVALSKIFVINNQ